MPTKAYLRYGSTQTQPLYERNLFLYPDKLSLSSQNIGGFCLVVGIQVALRRFWRDLIHDWNRSIPDEYILVTSNSSYLGLIQNSLSNSHWLLMIFTQLKKCSCLVLLSTDTQLSFTWPELTRATLEQGVKFVES